MNETEIAIAARSQAACPGAPNSLPLEPPARLTAQTRDWYRISAKADDSADITIYDAIGSWYDGVTAKQFVADLATLPASVKTIRVHVNSPGGDVFDAVAIANALRQHAARVEMSIEGLAASAATIITNGGGDSIRIADNALVMIHNAQGLAWGTAQDMRDTADVLDRIGDVIITSYQRHSALSREELAALMDAETWMNADEAMANGFATEKVDGLRAAALLGPHALARLSVPDRYRTQAAAFLTPPVPAPAVASATEVLRAVETAGFGAAFARELIDAALPMPAVQAKIDAAAAARMQAATRATEITALCATAKLPELAAGYIAGSMRTEDVRTHLTTITARLDRIEINSGLDPDQGARPKSVINVAAVYAARNKVQ